MNRRLVWNFEFSGEGPESLIKLGADKEETIKWEKRYFWREHQIIQLITIDASLLQLHDYQYKQKDDDYYLIHDSHANIKIRANELFYKPIIQHTSTATGFGTKVSLDLGPFNSKKEQIELKILGEKARKEGLSIPVSKEAFIYKFPTTPSIRLELAKLNIDNTIYFTACIEGNSLFLVEYLSAHLLGEQHPYDYVTFLKSVVRL